MSAREYTRDPQEEVPDERRRAEEKKRERVSGKTTETGGWVMNGA